MKALLKKQLLAVRESDGYHRLPKPKKKSRPGNKQRELKAVLKTVLRMLSRAVVRGVLADLGVNVLQEIVNLLRTTEDIRIRSTILLCLLDKIEPDAKYTNQTAKREPRYEDFIT
ncbi:hypothetical protein [Candidatus Magnetominusculus dajiuhuensis]|uniref:hypothetical protein n=1 Tax=Candidatus Magnetominusculus dajiuhuensis TaxID=3137712 RepID=UPI003B432072